jgi:GAF domain-containing protein
MAEQIWQVTDTLMSLADTLVSDYDLLDYLDQLLDRSSDVLGAHAGGVMLSDGGTRPETLHVLACTDEHARVLEVFELQRQEGPCVDSYRSGEQVIEQDLRSTTRWPTFTPAALARGYESVFAFPMRLRGSVIGALNLFRTAPGPVHGDVMRAAQAFADMATIGILHQRAVREAQEVAGHLQAALSSRVIIEQAKGVLAERLGLEMDEAYQAIRWYGRHHNRRLRAVAAAVVNGAISAHELIEPPGRLS